MSRYFSGNFMANYSAHFLAYRVIYFDFEIKTNNYLGIGVNFRTIFKSKQEELSENGGFDQGFSKSFENPWDLTVENQ